MQPPHRRLPQRCIFLLPVEVGCLTNPSLAGYLLNRRVLLTLFEAFMP